MFIRLIVGNTKNERWYPRSVVHTHSSNNWFPKLYIHASVTYSAYSQAWLVDVTLVMIINEGSLFYDLILSLGA